MCKMAIQERFFSTVNSYGCIVYRMQKIRKRIVYHKPLTASLTFQMFSLVSFASESLCFTCNAMFFFVNCFFFNLDFLRAAPFSTLCYRLLLVNSSFVCKTQKLNYSSEKRDAEADTQPCIAERTQRWRSTKCIQKQYRIYEHYVPKINNCKHFNIMNITNRANTMMAHGPTDGPIDDSSLPFSRFRFSLKIISSSFSCETVY